MALDEYRRKRDFSRTPEPSGDDDAGAASSDGRFFCVQKHLASHLHYDLRLELDGVLLSWAVPKGPSIDARDKRLAMQTEDHPLAYGTFEGVIPEGYGAGIVMLWDRGTWTPQVDDVAAALRKGDLKFALDGYKLKGSWALVRTRGAGPRAAGDGRSWLLIKHRDEWEGPIDIATFAPRSVKSDGDFEDILAADAPDVWRTNRPAKSGATGALLAEVIEKAAAIKAERDRSPAGTRPPAQAPGRRGPEQKEPGRKGPKKKDPGRKGPEKKDPGRKAPPKKDPERKAPPKKAPGRTRTPKRAGRARTTAARR